MYDQPRSANCRCLVGPDAHHVRRGIAEKARYLGDTYLARSGFKLYERIIAAHSDARAFQRFAYEKRTCGGGRAPVNLIRS